MATAMGMTITKVGRRSSLLSIETVSAFNGGDYVCRGENDVGSAYFKARLIVNGSLNLKIVNLRVDRNTVCFLIYLFICVWLLLFFTFIILFISVPPRITPFAFDGESFSPGHYATIQCTVPEGDFPLQITWLFNNKPLKGNVGVAMGVTIMKAGKRSSLLTIESVSAYNAGDFICKAENTVGSAFYKARLVVKGIPHHPANNCSINY